GGADVEMVAAPRLGADVEVALDLLAVDGRLALRAAHPQPFRHAALGSIRVWHGDPDPVRCHATPPSILAFPVIYLIRRPRSRQGQGNSLRRSAPTVADTTRASAPCVRAGHWSPRSATASAASRGRFSFAGCP